MEKGDIRAALFSLAYDPEKRNKASTLYPTQPEFQRLEQVLGGKSEKEKTPKTPSQMSVRRWQPQSARTNNSVHMFRTQKLLNREQEKATMGECLKVSQPCFEAELDRLYQEYWGRTMEDFESKDYEGVLLYSEATTKGKFTKAPPLSIN